MSKRINISNHVYYIGVNDRKKHLFENNWPLPNGVSYNSYIIADEKTALIVNHAEKKKKKLNELSLVELRKFVPKLTNDVMKVFDLRNSVNSKKSYGGTSFDNIKKMIIKYKKQK